MMKPGSTFLALGGIAILFMLIMLGDVSAPTTVRLVVAGIWLVIGGGAIAAGIWRRRKYERDQQLLAGAGMSDAQRAHKLAELKRPARRK